MITYYIILKLSPSTELFVEIMMKLIGIGIVIWITWGFYKAYNKDETPDYIKKNIEEEDRDVNDEIKKIEETFTKSLVEDNSKTSNFFINAIRKNYKYLRLKQLYIEREKEFSDDEIYHVLVRKTRQKILNEGIPIHSDCQNLFNEEILKLYKNLSQQYVELKLETLPFIETSHKIDLSNNKFFFVKVGNFIIPHFTNSLNKNLHFYIYPTVTIKYDKNGELKITDLQHNKITLKTIEKDNARFAILSFDTIDFEIITQNIKEAKSFYKSYLELQKHLIEKDWGLNNHTPSESKKELEIQNILKQLDSLVGLVKVKKDFYDIADYIKIQQIRKIKGLKTASANYHCIFVGNPGTGKTSMARLLADLYKQMGLVKTGQFIETDRSGLVAEYVGQTAIKTNKIFDEAIGGILFIDEAYSLASVNEDFGKEAISTLLKRMEDDRDKFIVILAGYNNEMQKFIDSNPGLKSRFTRTFEFEDYSAEELIEIFKRMLKDTDYILTDEASFKLNSLITSAVISKDKNFGNARYVRNIFEKTLQNQASRLSREKILNSQLLQTIEKEDIP